MLLYKSYSYILIQYYNYGLYLYCLCENLAVISGKGRSLKGLGHAKARVLAVVAVAWSVRN